LATGFGQLQVPANTAKQFHTERFLQQADLTAYGLCSEVELLTGTHNASCTRYNPEIVKLTIIEHGHVHFVKTEV
jgi:hypothetical protein